MAAALSSCYDKWDRLTSSLLIFQDTDLLSPELHNFHDNATLADTCIDPLFNPVDDFTLLSSDHNYSDFFSPQLSIHDYPSNCDDNCSFHTLPQDVKRQKQDQLYLQNNNVPCFLDGYLPNSTISTTSIPQLANFAPSSIYSCGSVENLNKTNGESLNAQSVAARRRRRRITQKTEELGKLVPSGSKMNIAEMLQSAFKYVKYLQAQVGVLQMMGTISTTQNDGNLFHQDDLHVLLESPIIQETMYSSEMCLVPKRFVEDLANDPEMQSNDTILTEINQLLHSEG